MQSRSACLTSHLPWTLCTPAHVPETHQEPLLHAAEAWNLLSPLLGGLCLQTFTWWLIQVSQLTHHPFSLKALQHTC